MQEKVKIVPSKELAYWVGVAQSDGSFQKYFERGRTKPRYRVTLEVAENSRPMIIKFTELSQTLFRRKSAIWKTKRGRFSMHIGVTGLKETFKDLGIDFKDPPQPPFWCLDDKFFGAYLAGIIDGDGTVAIKRSKYPQCLIRITSGKPQSKLSIAIEKVLKCSTYIVACKKRKVILDRVCDCKWYDLGFLVSSKTCKFFKKFVLPYMQLEYKKLSIESYIISRWSTNQGVVV